MAVKAVVFDVGGVLYQWSLRYLFEKLIPDAQELDWFLANVVTTDWHFQHDAGRGLADMVGERCAEFPEHAHLIRAYAARFNETIPGPVAGTHAIVHALAARNIPIFGITNFGAEFWSGFKPTAPVFDMFSDIVVSGAEKLIKPDPAIYDLARTRFGLLPGEGLFIDDSLTNVQAARSNGFAGHHFINAAGLATELRQRGLLA